MPTTVAPNNTLRAQIRALTGNGFATASIARAVFPQGMVNRHARFDHTPETVLIAEKQGNPNTELPTNWVNGQKPNPQQIHTLHGPDLIPQHFANEPRPIRVSDPAWGYANATEQRL
jgi:hypothetical protein